MDTGSARSFPRPAARWPDGPENEKREFLVFRVGGNDFGMDIRKVRELRHFGTLGRIADGGRLIPGVVSVNRRVIPLVDLRRQFTSSPMLYDEQTNVVIARVGQSDVCIVVDNVLDTAALAPDDLQPLPDAGALIGTASWASRQLILMDIDKLLLGTGQGATGESVRQ
jgi:purine-binding chemotaxis protein CheW